MICIELSFTDDPARLAARPAHRERLGELHASGLLLAAGPWQDNTGALVILSVDNDRQAQDIMDRDPYFTTPGVVVRAVRAWQPILGP